MKSTHLCSLLLLAACARPQNGTPPSTNTPTPPVAPAPTPASAVTPAVREGLVSALSGFEHIPTKEELDRLGGPPALVAGLTSLYQDVSLEPIVRINALASLRFYPGPQSRAVLEKALMSPDTTDPARRAAVKAYGAGFGPQAVPILDRLLDHPELHTRNAAAGTLASIHDERAQEALRRHLPQEKEPLVRKTIEGGLSR